MGALTVSNSTTISPLLVSMQTVAAAVLALEAAIPAALQVVVGATGTGLGFGFGAGKLSLPEPPPPPQALNRTSRPRLPAVMADLADIRDREEELVFIRDSLAFLVSKNKAQKNGGRKGTASKRSQYLC